MLQEDPSTYEGPATNDGQSSDIPKTVHIYGLGSIGKLVAHSIRSTQNPPPVTLIAHRWPLYKAWTSARRPMITIEQDGYRMGATGFGMEYAPTPKRVHGVETDHPETIYDDPTGLKPHEAARRYKERAAVMAAEEAVSEEQPMAGQRAVAQEQSSEFQQTPDANEDQGEIHKRPAAVQEASTGPPAEEADEQPQSDLPEGEEEADRSRLGQSDEPIYHLILTVKAPRTLSALSALKHRLRPESTICILQNGMGTLDVVKQELFPDPAKRPNFILGIVTHGANTPRGSGPFFAVHAGHGTIALGVQPRDDVTSESIEEKTEFAPTSRHLLRTLTRVPVLAAVGLPQSEFLQQQLEKLAQNAVVNPMTVMMDAPNGSLLYNFYYTRVMRLILGEISLVIRSLPELQGLPNVNNRFSPERLETLVVGIARKTANNISSMLADVRNGVTTEIEYINGYIYRRGQDVGVQCVTNYMMMQLVRGKNEMIKKELLDAVPMSKVDLSTGERTIEARSSDDYRQGEDRHLR